jgi:hypothetical protein
MIPETRQTDFGNIQQAHRITIYFDGKESSNYNTSLGAFTLNFSPNEDLNLKLIASTYSAIEAENYDIQGQYWIGQLETNPGDSLAGNVISTQGVGTTVLHMIILDGNINRKLKNIIKRICSPGKNLTFLREWRRMYF